jgi:hypothetical protein
VGNLPHNKIPYMLASALSEKHRLVDTSHTNSALEVLVGRSLTRLVGANAAAGGGKKHIAASGSVDSNVYHVVIKIYHTHLGYERTMQSVQDSLSDILPGYSASKRQLLDNSQGSSTNITPSSSSGVDIRIHAILQYPRCYDTLFTSHLYLNSPNFPQKYTSCQEEEEALDETIKLTGSSPLLDKDNAWKRSYRALEELYHHGTLESIGVSNFGPADMESLYDLSTVGPHVYQGTLRTLLLEEELVEGLVKHGVHYQCYDVVSTVLEGKGDAQRAYEMLERIGAKLGNVQRNGVIANENNVGYSGVQVVLGWLVQRGVGVIPGTVNLQHLVENSPDVLASMPRFTPREALDVEMAVLALLRGEDLDDEGTASGIASAVNEARKHTMIMGREYSSLVDGMDEISSHGMSSTADQDGVVATFFNSLKRNIRIFHIHPTTGQQLQISQSIPPGRSGRILVNPSDVLIAYDGHGVAVKKFLVREGEKAAGKVEFSVGEL